MAPDKALNYPISAAAVKTQGVGVPTKKQRMEETVKWHLQEILF